MDEKKVIIEIAVDAAKAVNTIAGLNVAIKEQNDLLKTLDKNSDAYKTAQVKLAAYESEKKVLTQATKEEVKVAELNRIITDSTSTSYNKLSAQYRLNMIELNKMSEAEKTGTEKGKELTAQSLALRNAMSSAKQATGDHTLEVGKYEKALGNLKAGWGQITGVVSGVVGALASVGISYEAFKKVLATSSTAQDHFNEVVKGAEFATKSFFNTIRTGDWSNLIDNMELAYQKGVEYEKMITILERREKSIQYARVEENVILAELADKVITGWDLEKKRELTTKERLELAKKWQTETENQYNRMTTLAKQESDAEVERWVNKNRNAEQVRKDLQNYLLLDAADENLRLNAVNLNEEIQKRKDLINDVGTVIRIQGGAEVKTGGISESNRKIYQKEVDVLLSRNDAVANYAKILREYEGEASSEKLAALVASLQKEKQAEVAFFEEKKRINKQVATLNKKDIADNEAASKKADEDRKNRLSELESLRIELLSSTLEKEKALEEKRYNDYIEKWGKLNGAYELHVKKLFEIDEAYRKANEKGDLEFAKKQQEYFEEYLDHETLKEQKTTETDKYIADRQKGINEQLQKDREDQQKLAESQLASIQQYSEELSGIVSASIDENGLNLKNFGQSLSIFILDILKKQTEAAVAAAFVGSMATPASIGTGGIAGVLQAGILTALIETAFGIAKGQITKPVQGLATGTPQVTQGGQFIVGEKGPEEIYLPAGTAVIPNSLMDFKQFGTFAAPQMSNNDMKLIQAIKNIKVITTIEAINAVAKAEAIRLDLNKV